MFKSNRCCERPTYNNETSFKYSAGQIGSMEYPEAMPAWTNVQNQMPMMGMQVPPVYECPQERVCHKEILHEVPQE